MVRNRDVAEEMFNAIIPCWLIDWSGLEFRRQFNRWLIDWLIDWSIKVEFQRIPHGLIAWFDDYQSIFNTSLRLIDWLIDTTKTQFFIQPCCLSAVEKNIHLLFREKQSKFFPGQLHQAVHFLGGTLEILDAKRVDRHLADAQIQAPFQRLRQLIKTHQMALLAVHMSARGIPSITVHNDGHVPRNGAPLDDVEGQSLQPRPFVLSNPRVAHTSFVLHVFPVTWKLIWEKKL